MDIGINTGFDYLMNFGFTQYMTILNEMKSFTDKTPSLAGGLTDGVTVLELTALMELC